MARTLEFQPELYDEVPPGYCDEVYCRGRGIQCFWHHHRFRAVAESLPPDGDRILDIGCGPGTFLAHFASAWRSGVGTHLAQPQVEYARGKYGSGRLRFESGGAAAMTHSELFDTIVGIEVIEQ